MNHTGCQATDGGQFLRSCDGPMRFHPSSDVFAHSNHMCDVVTCAGAHRYLANQPVVGFAVAGDRFLLDSVNSASCKDAVKFSLQQFAALFAENLENVLTQSVSSW